MKIGKIQKFIGITIAGIGIAVVLFAVGKTIVTTAINKAAADEYSSYAVISDEAGLQEAMNASTTQKYVVENIPLKGTMIQDSEGILKGEYTVIYKGCEKYIRKSSGSSRRGRRRYTNTWSGYPSGSSFKVINDATILSGTSVMLTKDNSDGWAQISLSENNCSRPSNIVSGMYYENKSSSPKVGDMRYTYYVVPANTTLTFIAEVGNGTFTALPLSKSDKIYLYGSSDTALIQYVGDGLNREGVASSVFTGFVGVFLIIFGGVSMLNKGKRAVIRGNSINMAGGRQLKSERYFNEDGTAKNDNAMTNSDMFEDMSKSFGADYTSEGSMKVKSNRYFNDDGTPINRNDSGSDNYGTSDSDYTQNYYNDPPKKNDKDDDDKSMPSLFL